MATREHGGGSSFDASIGAEGADCPGLAALLLYFPRPPSAPETLRGIPADHLVYAHVKPHVKPVPRSETQDPSFLADSVSVLENHAAAGMKDGCPEVRQKPFQRGEELRRLRFVALPLIAPSPETAAPAIPGSTPP